MSLLLSYSSVFISPEKFWVPAFFGLAFPVIFLANFLFVIYWAIRKRKKLFFTSLILILLGLTYVFDYFQFGFLKNISQENKPVLKILSYNVKLFDLYNWTNNINTRNEIFNIIDKENADILCFQEFYKEDINRFNTLDTLLKFQDAKYYHDEYSQIKANTYYFGIITLSKYPIVNKGLFKFKNSDNICIYSDIVYNNDTLRVYNNHLESIRFDIEDHSFIDNLEIDEIKLKGIKSIYTRLKEAFVKRSEQVDMISYHIAQSPYPVIVCGDFNDTPVSYAYRKLKRNLKDSFKESGSGFGKTYTGKFPSFRIDYIFHSEDMKCIDFNIIKKSYSDHYPIVGKLVFNNELLSE